MAAPAISRQSRSAPLATFRGVGKTFPNGITALSGLDFDIRDGEFLSLLGPSGCGKSTALRLLAGLVESSEGEVVWHVGAGRREIGFVFQEPTLMPWTTVACNVRLPLRLQNASADSSRLRVEEALDLVGLADFRDAYPRELSGGMKMRASIARALAAEPTVLLMDEPFAALDELTRERLNDELRELWAAKKLTIIFVTHSIYESVYLSSRILVMSPRPGRVVADIPMSEPVARDPEYRMTPIYGERCRAVRAALKEGGSA
jgi:NitT/TauT family transport system ATP-binding protein